MEMWQKVFPPRTVGTVLHDLRFPLNPAVLYLVPPVLHERLKAPCSVVTLTLGREANKLPNSIIFLTGGEILPYSFFCVPLGTACRVENYGPERNPEERLQVIHR